MEYYGGNLPFYCDESVLFLHISSFLAFLVSSQCVCVLEHVCMLFICLKMVMLGSGAHGGMFTACHM